MDELDSIQIAMRSVRSLQRISRTSPFNERMKVTYDKAASELSEQAMLEMKYLIERFGNTPGTLAAQLVHRLR